MTLAEGIQHERNVAEQYLVTYVKSHHPKAMQLQSVGWVLGAPAIELKAGDMTMWNFGSLQEIVSIDRETAQFVVCTLRSVESGKIYPDVKYKKTRLLCVLKKK